MEVAQEVRYGRVEPWLGRPPVVYAMGGGGWFLPMEGRQNGESVDLTFGLWEAP